MDGIKRREQLLLQLTGQEKPISASKFAKQFDVSRQVIVGDVALLRAAGYEIMATARGYLLKNSDSENGIERKIVCQHAPDQTEAELRAIVELGGEVIDVIVEHPLYGELQGGLHIKTLADVDNFVTAYQKNPASLLSALTDGIHLHTIRCQDEEQLERIKAALADQNILYHNE